MTVTAELSGKVAAVTGASSGIGEATAVMLADAGAAVSFAARRSDRITDLEKRIEGSGGRALAIEADLGDEEQANTFIRKTKEELGSVDILVNNAGLMLLGPVIGADTSEWQRMVDINLLGLLYCTHAELPIM
jgi:NADP-dependent 3-hydroxy acid dehydrogenase YdfG